MSLTSYLTGSVRLASIFTVNLVFKWQHQGHEKSIRVARKQSKWKEMTVTFKPVSRSIQCELKT